MNIIDAIKSGKPYRRKSLGNVWYNVPMLSHSIDDIVADDWEIQEPTVTITRTQFRAAMSDAYRENGNLYPPAHELVAALARKLGLEP